MVCLCCMHYPLYCFAAPALQHSTPITYTVAIIYKLTGRTMYDDNDDPQPKPPNTRTSQWFWVYI